MSGDRGKVCSGMGQEDLHLGAPVVEPACAHQRSTSVPACPCQDHHCFTARIAIEEAHSRKMGQVASSVFHHLHQLNAFIFHHGPVHLDHLLRSHIMQLARVVRNGHTVSLLSSKTSTASRTMCYTLNTS